MQRTSFPLPVTHPKRRRQSVTTRVATITLAGLLPLTLSSAPATATSATLLSAPAGPTQSVGAPALPALRAVSTMPAMRPALHRTDLAWVRCPKGAGAIGVSPKIARQLRNLIKQGLRQGVPICGHGWRSHHHQVRLRVQHCGSSTKAVYRWPPRWCTPPTARPGRSMHERGLAVDFRPLRGVSRSAMYRWLRHHAPRHGLYQLPSEKWHYSLTGR